jgi:hypothetical protein
VATDKSQSRSQRQRVETRSLPTLTRSYPRRFTFYVADPISSIQLFAADTAAATAFSQAARAAATDFEG